MSVTTGIGWDSHRLTEGRPLIIGGVTIPHERGLAGHSDADVLTHAIIDALLGAAALGDIGTHFPDTDERWRGADSLSLLRTVMAMLDERGLTVAHVDATVVMERPKLAPHREAIRAALGAALGRRGRCRQREGLHRRGDGLRGARGGRRGARRGDAQARLTARAPSATGRRGGRARRPPRSRNLRLSR